MVTGQFQPIGTHLCCVPPGRCWPSSFVLADRPSFPEPHERASSELLQDAGQSSVQGQDVFAKEYMLPTQEQVGGSTPAPMQRRLQPAHQKIVFRGIYHYAPNCPILRLPRYKAPCLAGPVNLLGYFL